MQEYERRIQADVKQEKVPIYLKMALTIREAAEYSNIGIKATPYNLPAKLEKGMSLVQHREAALKAGQMA